MGTLRYAAPEQLAAASLAVGPAADVRGLGVTLWELLTRRRLFAEAEDEKQLAALVYDTDVPRLRTVDRGFDRDLEAIVARATERRAADRIPTAGRLAEYLDLYLQGKSLPIRPPGCGELAWRWMRRHKLRVAAALALLVLAFGSVAGLWLWNTSERRRRDEAGDHIARMKQAAESDEQTALVEIQSDRFADGGTLLDQAAQRVQGIDGLDDLLRRLTAERDRASALRGFIACRTRPNCWRSRRRTSSRSRRPKRRSNGWASSGTRPGSTTCRRPTSRRRRRNVYAKRCTRS